jgi:EmrB/QacA subfamily drug resistance transporter
MVILDGTIVNIALPSAQRALAFSNADRQWIVTAYALSFGSLLLLGGRLADIIGRKRALILGLVGFAGASAVGGFSTSFAMLVSARTIQGAFGAILAPAVLSLLTTTFADPGERGRAFAIYGAIAGAGGAIGLLLGGVLTSYASWRWTLFVNLFFAAVAVPSAARLLHHEVADDRDPLDVPGIATVTGGLFALVYGLSHAQTTSWSDPVTIGFLVGGAALLAVFAALETRVAHPLLPLRVVLDRTRGGSLLAMLFAGAGLFGVFLFLTYYLQSTLGYSPVRTGVAFLPMVVALAAMSQLATRKLLPLVGPKPLAAIGMAISAGAMVLFAQLGLHSSYVTEILPALLLVGGGFGLMISPSTNTATLGVSRADAGVASATVNTGQQIGGSIGTALLNTLAASAGAAYLAAHAAALRASTASSREVVALSGLHSYTTAFAWGAVVFGIGAVTAGLVLRRGVTPGSGLPAVAPSGGLARSGAAGATA